MAAAVLDTSVVISGAAGRLAREGALDGAEVIIPEAVVDELRSQASRGEERGLAGLEEIRRLRGLAAEHRMEVRFEGARPTADDVRLAGRGRIDALIKDVARGRGATLYTSDRVQAAAAEAEGVPARLVRSGGRGAEMEFLRYFGPDTMSVHLKEGMRPAAKRGGPGSFELVQAGGEELTREYLRGVAAQILEDPGVQEAGVEISRPGATVAQYRDYRVSITQRPFSEAYEITIVHPIARPGLHEFGASDKLMARLASGAEGIVVSGPPGSGKSTLASALANSYNSRGKVVKTFESPRDLQVDPGVTQYTKLDGSFENAADILLLVRPDYTVFDEVRRREDFGTFADLRMAGVGMVGVVHASTPLDAIQRFVGKVDLGMIPSVIDTVVFVSGGRIAKAYELELKVKVPAGMTEQDLARPVIEVRDFEDSSPQYEIYTFGEENVIMPVSGAAAAGSGIDGAALREAFRRYDPGAQVEVMSGSRVRVRVARRHVASVIGRGGSNVGELERELGVRIDVAERGQEAPGGDVPFEMRESRGAVVLEVGREHAGMRAEVSAGGELVAGSRVGRRGQIRIPRRSEAARRLAAAPPGAEITVSLSAP